MANYKVTGGDLKQYGPVSSDDMRKWIADGRLNAQTRVQIEGTNEWKLLAEIPELEEMLRSCAPPLPTVAPAVPAKTSGLAVTSLVLGVLGLFICGITALIGLILGIIAMVKVSNSRGALRGNGIALAGIIVSGIFLLMIPIFAAMLLPALAAAKQKAQEINCISNEKQLAVAVRIYSNENTNHFPPAVMWCDAIKTSVGTETVFKCPAANASSRCDYAFNSKLDGMDESKIDPQTVMIFESDAGWNAGGGRELMISHARHEHGRVFIMAFADGSVREIPESQIGTLRWDP